MKDFEILDTKGSWLDVLNTCRSTVSKKFLTKEPSEEFKRAIIVSEHSPIRTKLIKWVWRNLPYWVSTHFARHHIGFEKWISTQRNDRQEFYDREKAPQDAPVIFVGEGNTQALINMSKVRLCFTASKATRDKMVELKKGIKEIDKTTAWAMVPSCIYRGGCPEKGLGVKCDFYKKFLERHPEITASTTLEERYDAYYEDFFNEKYEA